MVADKRQSRRWCFTINNPTDLDCEAVLKTASDSKCVYLIAGDEVGEGGTPHIQGFCVFERDWRFNRILKSLGGRCHLEPARGTSVQAADYIRNNPEKPHPKFEEYGECPIDDEEKSVRGIEFWDNIKKLAESGNLSDIPSDIFIRYKKTLESIAFDNMSMPPALDRLDNEWWYGETGTGKSLKAWREYPDAYRKMNNKWWDGYAHQDVVVIEEWAPVHHVLADKFKQWADHYPFRAEIKGGSKMIRPKKIIVCSNYSIAECFPTKQDRDPIQRRFHSTIFRSDLMSMHTSVSQL